MNILAFRLSVESERRQLMAVLPYLNREGLIKLSAYEKVSRMAAFSADSISLYRLINAEWKEGGISLQELRAIMPALEALDRMAKKENRRVWVTI